MWKKSSRNKGPVIGTPTLMETSMNEQSLQSMRGVGNTQPRNSVTLDETPELPRLPFKSMAPEPSQDPGAYQPPPNVRPPSSIYTDPRYSTVRESQSIYTDVSPPDSPTYGGGMARGSPDISPIEDGEARSAGNSRQESRFTSSLPVPRKRAETGSGSGGGSQQPAKNEGYTSPRDNRTTRWDDFSGEPTTSDKGKAAQATPRTSSLHQPPAPEPSSRHQFNILAKGRELNQARRRLMEKRQPEPIETSPAQRQPWKGASGRNAIVNPIRPKANSTAAETPKPLPKLDARPRQASASSPSPLDATQSPSASKTGPFRPRTSSKAASNAPLGGSAGPSIQSPVPSSGDGDKTPPARNPYPQPENSLPTPSSNPSTHTIKPVEASSSDYKDQFQNLALHENPSSRFSFSTYATSPPDTPRQSVDMNAPPIPDIPPTMASRKFPMSSAASIMSAKSTTRKPTPSQISIATTTGTAKDLPQCPPEMEAQNRVDVLQARLDALARRKGNIGTIIHELTQVVQPSSIAYDLATRDEVKKTVTSLNNELDDIKKEEHDLGLKLLRAWKKRDEEDMYHESSGLWVKRVTG
ncbi:hypothetical protein FQN54_003984 [Arachnomyces sp. PD_36]|nr:hypothetical protein FQN54_003984 [Arachnomyces sp. PD_36]